MKKEDFKLIEKFPRFIVAYDFSKMESLSYAFETKEQAEAQYNHVAALILSDTKNLKSSHWYNNSEGLSVEITELKTVPDYVFDELKDAKTEEEKEKIWTECLVNCSETIKYTYTFMGDIYNPETDSVEIEQKEIIY